MIGNIAREPNGRHRRKPPSERAVERVADIIGVVVAQPHRRGYGKDSMSWLAESPFGSLRLSGVISEPQYQAGLFWRRLVGRAKWAIACPPDRPSQLQLLKTYGLGREPTEEESLTARREYDDAVHSVREKLTAYNGHRVIRILKFVVCQDYPCDDVGLLKAGLNILIRYQELTRRKADAKVTSL